MFTVAPAATDICLHLSHEHGPPPLHTVPKSQIKAALRPNLPCPVPSNAILNFSIQLNPPDHSISPSQGGTPSTNLTTLPTLRRAIVLKSQPSLPSLIDPSSRCSALLHLEPFPLLSTILVVVPENETTLRVFVIKGPTSSLARPPLAGLRSKPNILLYTPCR